MSHGHGLCEDAPADMRFQRRARHKVNPASDQSRNGGFEGDERRQPDRSFELYQYVYVTSSARFAARHRAEQGERPDRPALPEVGQARPQYSQDFILFAHAGIHNGVRMEIPHSARFPRLRAAPEL